MGSGCEADGFFLIGKIDQSIFGDTCKLDF